MTTTVTLGGKQFEVTTLPFGQLRRLLPLINSTAMALGRNAVTATVLDDLVKVLAAGLRMSPEELDAMEIQLHEIGPAFDAVIEAAGLETKARTPGEPAVANGIGTSSTPTSPPASAGPGETLTS